MKIYYHEKISSMYHVRLKEKGGEGEDKSEVPDSNLSWVYAVSCSIHWVAEKSSSGELSS